MTLIKVYAFSVKKNHFQLEDLEHYIPSITRCHDSPRVDMKSGSGGQTQHKYRDLARLRMLFLSGSDGMSTIRPTTVLWRTQSHILRELWYMRLPYAQGISRHILIL